MDIPGMNPLQNRMIVPGQAQPAGPQPAVPDLILDAPRTPVAQPQQQPATAMPFQAPAQAVVQAVMQDMTAALMEMGMTPTPQNQQMAQLLAGYGHGVNQQTMGILRQAVAALPDKSPATLEAAVILLTKGVPVTEQNVTAIKQFMNSQPLPQQLQNLPKDLGSLMQQLQQTAQSSTAATLPPAQAAQSTQAAAQTGQAQPAPQTIAGQAGPVVQGAQIPGQAIQPGQVGQPGQAALPGQPGPQGAQQISQQAAQQITQAVQSGQSLIQAAPTSAIVQQAAGQAQSVENRADGVTRLSERSTAQKVDMPDLGQETLKAIKEVGGQQASQSTQVSQHLPSARQNDQQSLQQLNLMLQGGELAAVDKVMPGVATSIQSPEEAVLQLLKVMQQLGQISGHLAENMQLQDYKQLHIQHQQIQQLTGLLENKLNEFHQLFAKAFPELADDVQRLLQQDGQDMFSKLAQLIDENQTRLQEKLRLPGGDDAQNQVLSTLRQLMEQVGVQVEKIQSHMVARELLSQNLPIHVVPIMVHAHGEAYPAEIYVQQDYDPEDSRQGPDSGRPFKLTLTLETKNMGRVSVDLAALKDDMSLDLKVQTRRIKLFVDEQILDLKSRVEREGDYKLSHLGCQVVPELESRQSMLLPAKRNIRSLRRVEGVV